MANTYSQIYLHLVFAVKGRDSLINEAFRNELEKYICGIVTLKEQKILAIYCMPDHAHLLISLKPTCSISDFVRDIKNNSSKFINEQKLLKGKFYWQEGYGVFSYSKSQLDKVVKYIIYQPVHHKIKTFKEEYIELLKKFEIEFNEKYLFETYC